jgi:rifampicin phosphotransferase
MATAIAGDVLRLGEEGTADVATSGAKAAVLAALSQQGFPVPSGFIVTTGTCEHIVAAVGADDGTAAAFPSGVRAAIEAALHRLGDGDVAVRSSGTSEDLPDASYAGQYETVLGVHGTDEVVAAVLHCLDSARSARLRAYAGAEQTPMAVLVQRLVPADAAGVAFTANPVTGDDEVLVSSVQGIGDRLVSGEATPDEWVARGDQLQSIRSTENSLDAEQAGAVVALARRAASTAGAPQDVEWAISGGELFLLQARPITALPRQPDLEPPVTGFWTKDTTHYPMPLTPFGASVYLPAMDRAAPALGADLGVLFDGFEQRSLGGEVYVRFIPAGGKDRPPPPAWLLWLLARTVPDLRRRNRVAEKALTDQTWKELVDQWETDWRPSFRDEAETLKRVDLQALSDDDLLRHLDVVRDFLDRGQILHFRLSGAFVLPLYDLVAMCEELLGWSSFDALTLVAGASQASSEPGRELDALARRLEADPAAVDALAGGGDDVIARLEQSSPSAARAFQSYLDRFGHRTASYDPGDPTLFERPALVAGLVRDRIEDRERTLHDGTEHAEPALARARAELADRPEEDRARFEEVVATARRVYGNREDNIFWLDNQPCALLRYLAVEIGRRLAHRGLVTRAHDAVFLTAGELGQVLIDGTADDLRARVARRKAERAWVVAHPGPASYGVDPGPPPDLRFLPRPLRLVNEATLHWRDLLFAVAEPARSPNQLRGVAGSPGRYTGPVRIIRDEADFGRLRPGEVLVCPITSPAWSVLFVQAGAIVTDGGSVLAHTAVIAREYGIPAVLATTNSTGRLHDGDVVTVDGTAGTVTIDDAGGGSRRSPTPHMTA